MKNNFDLRKFLVENKLTSNSKNQRVLKEDIDMSSKDGYIAFLDNENIFADYSLEDIEEMAAELAMHHFDAGKDQDNFYKSFMAAYKESGYMTDDI